MGKFDRNSLALATIKERYPLTMEDSSKETWHITLDITGIDLDYLPGDSIGICAQNDPILVDHLIQAMGAASSNTITHKRTKKTHTLHDFLSYHANLARITSHFLNLINECTTCSKSKQEIATLINHTIQYVL